MSRTFRYQPRADGAWCQEDKIPLERLKIIKGFIKGQMLWLWQIWPLQAQLPKGGKGVKKLNNGPLGPKQESGPATEDAIT